jgi:pimeloyl-ACP methyl ester carboxylesterase
MRMQLPHVRMQVMAYPSQTPLTYQQLATLVRAQLPESGDVVILGESFSGPIALALAADPPPNVLALVLTTTFAKLPAPYFSLLAPLSRWLPIGVLPSSWVAPWLLGSWSNRRLRQALAGAIDQVEPSVLRFRVAETLRVNVLARCRSIRMPVLYLQATRDLLLPDRAGRELQSVIERLSIVRIEGPHLLLQAAAHDCAKAISDFVAALR